MRRGPQMKHSPTWFITICCVAVLCATGACDSTVTPSASGPNSATQPDVQAAIEPVKLREDLDFLLATIEKSHPNMYAYIDKIEFGALTAAAYARLDGPMQVGEFYRLVAPVVAAIRSGHTLMLPPGTAEYMRSVAAGGKVFILTLDCTSDHPVLMEYTSTSNLPIGGKVLSINGADAARMTARYARCAASEGKVSDRRSLSNFLPVFLWADFGTENPLSVKMQLEDGTIEEYDLEPVTMKEAEKLRGVEKSLEDYSYRYLAEHGTGVINWRKFRERPGFQKFLRETFAEIQGKKVQTLVIDLRENGGGDSRLGRDMVDYLYDKPYTEFSRFSVRISPLLREQQSGFIQMARTLLKGREPQDGELVSVEGKLVQQYLSENPLRFSGQVYVLIGPKTASSAVTFASMAKHYRIATLVGEETGDTTACYGDSLRFELPNSRLQCVVACKYFVNMGSREDLRGVLPDHEVKLTPSDSANGIDTVMQYILGLAKK